MPDARHKTILDQVETVIEGLTLTGIATDDIFQMLVPGDDPKYLATLPSVVISPFGVENVTARSAQGDDVGYPVVVAIVAGADVDQITNLNSYLLWRETIWDAFHNQRLSANADNITCTVEPGPIIDRTAWANNFLVSILTIRVHQRVTRS